jgi:tetratricopeptide (TPR) repeat protein
VVNFTLSREGRLLYTILLLHLAAPSPEAQQAEEFVHSSIRDFDRGDFERALHEAEEAYRLYPLAQILFNIGQCQRALKHWDKAAFYYGRYIQKLPNAPNRATVEELQAEVEYRAKAEALQKPPAEKPPPPLAAAPPRLADPPPPATPDSSSGVPSAALESPAPSPAEASHSHAAAYTLGSIALASAVVMVIGIVEVESFEAVVGRLSNPTTYPAWQADDATASKQLPQAQAWQWVAGITGGVALGTGTAAVLTW